ncbi:MAG: O-antigen ligase family protein, partial [Bacillota bacterium]|nr:O-antigen ligase family protein [Bacillota bacterium]
NNLGMYFVFAVFPFLLLLIKEKNRKNKLIYSMLTLLSLVNIIFSYSRNALIGFAVGITVLIAVFGIRYLFLTIIPALFVFFIPSLSNRIKDISDVSQNLSRIKLWTLAGLIIKDHPILGIGNGNFGKYKNDYPINFAEYNITEVYHPHNAFLKAYCELGLIGLISFTGMIVSSFFVLHKFIKNQGNNFYNWFYTGVFISLFAMVFMNLIDSFFSAPKVIVYYFIVMGVCEGIRIRQGKISR